MSAPDVVTLIGTSIIHPGKANQFKANCEAMVALRGKEPDDLASAYSFDGDGGAVSREDYQNADAVIQHMQLGEHIFEQTRELVDITGVELHGPAEQLDKLREPLDDLSPRYFVTESGFRR